MLVGRGREVQALEQCLDTALNGRGALRVLSGEPGIGKTRLADEIVARATARGFHASWGRAWETGGAPAYWPWIELLGPLAETADVLPDRVRALLGSPASATLGEGTRADPARERFELFESVAGFVRGCARRQPLLLVFDDLHAADEASLELLGFVARGLRAARVVALCTARDAEARLPRVADLIARITREGEALVLRPLSSEDVVEVVRCELGSCDAALGAAVSELTEGNPLFLRETLHAVNAHRIGVSLDALREVAALGGVLALVRSRLAGACDETRVLLDLAAALGRELPLAVLADAAGKTAHDTRAVLEDATARGLLVRRGGDRWAFSHVLVREAFYRELAADKRRALHHAIALALRKRLAERAAVEASASELSLATLAYHEATALPLGDPVAAVRTACRAAAHARAQLAYEAAIALLERALTTCDEHGVGERERAEVALALGWAATEAGELARGREVFREAAEIARRLDDSTLLARAALGQGGEYVLAEIRAELVDALREALRALEDRTGDEARRLRARVLARLAAALTPSATPQEPLGLAREALAMTEGENDARTLIDVDVGVGAALTDFAPPVERIPVNDRLLREARRVSDRVLELRALTRLSCDHIEEGDVARSDAMIAARASLADSIGHARYLWQTPLLRSMQAMPYGRFDECEAYIAQARRLAAEAADPNAERCIEFHRFTMLLVAGRPDELRMQEARAHRTLLTLLGNEDLHAWIAAVAAARLGDKARAALVLRGVKRTRNTARMERVTLIEAAVLCGCREFYEPRYPEFDASDNRNSCWGPFAFACGPPIARTLAMAAFALGRPEEALRHCERALALVERTSATAHRAWVHLAWGEGTGAREHLERACEVAERLDMPEVVQRARAAADSARGAAHGSARPARPVESPAPSLAMRCDRDRNEWTIEYAGRAFHLKNVRGLGMLARLVEHAGREIHALDLASEGDGATGAVVDLGDAGAVIDPRARAAYKARIDTLREELEEAESWHDGGRAASIRDEMEALTRQIAAAVGLGGRERRSGSAAERARIAVQRRIREAIKKIASHDAELGRHLDWAVRTGTFCAYEPLGRKSAR